MHPIIGSCHQLMQANDFSQCALAAANQIKPMSAKLRNYPQSMSNLIAGAHVELTKVTESQILKATQGVASVSNEIARMASAEAEKVSQRQRARLEEISLASCRATDGASPAQ